MGSTIKLNKYVLLSRERVIYKENLILPNHPQSASFFSLAHYTLLIICSNKTFPITLHARAVNVLEWTIILSKFILTRWNTEDHYRLLINAKSEKLLFYDWNVHFHKVQLHIEKENFLFVVNIPSVLFDL